MFEAGNSGQLYLIFLFCGLGYLLGLYYDIFRIVRLIMQSGKWTVFIEDIIFCLTSTLLFFLYSLSLTGGHIRWHLTFGAAVGFWAYRVTMSKLVVWFAQKLYALILRLWSLIVAVITFPFTLLFRLLHPVFAVFSTFFHFLFAKCCIFFKKLLKKPAQLVYNKKKSMSPEQETKRPVPPMTTERDF